MTAASVQTYARIAGLLFLISGVAGGFGEFFVPSQLIVPGDATATANNIVTSDALFRLGFASYFVGAVCDIALALILYVLLRPVGRELALLAAFFRLVSTAVFAVAELLLFAALPILGGAESLKTFSPDQLNALAFVSIRLYGYGVGVAMVFYGVGSILFGFLMYRSGYLPKVLGALIALSGFGFLIRSFAMVMTPVYASSALLLPTAVAGLALTLWLLLRGVDLPKWELRDAETAGGARL